MKAISTRELQHQTRKIRERVVRGETVVWENRGRVIAYITPAPVSVDQPVDWPDVMARLKKQFGGKVFADSQPLLDEMRGERF